MKFENIQNSDEFAVSANFEPQDIPILLEANELFLPKTYSEDHDAFMTSSIILQAMSTYYDENPKTLKIGLRPEEYPIFSNKLHEATSELLSEYLAFWLAVTSKYPSWLLQENVDINGEQANSNPDETHDPFNGRYLDQLEAKLKHMVALNKEFRVTSNSSN